MFIQNRHPNQNVIFVLDNTSKQLNRSLAMKHSFFLQGVTTSGIRLKHVLEIPFFVESYLSNGVQLADLCAYDVYRAFFRQQEDYPFFQKILSYIEVSSRTRNGKIDGLKVFPETDKWKVFITKVENERARLLQERAQFDVQPPIK
jgi:hypothetical protein